MKELKSGYDLVILENVLGGIVLVGLVIISIGGCYIYYLLLDEILEEFWFVNMDVVLVVLSGDWDIVVYWILVYEDWMCKLWVSYFLCGSEMFDY